MNAKTILGVSITAVFAVSLMMSSAMASHSSFASWQGVSSSTATQTSKQTTLTLVATGDVPRKTGALAGFAWSYSTGINSAFAITTHNLDADPSQNPKNDVRDSTQNPDGWHAHNVILAGAANANGHICVLDLSDAPTAGISMNGPNVKVQVRNSVTTGGFTGGAAAAAIVVDGACLNTVGTENSALGALPLALDVAP